MKNILNKHWLFTFFIMLFMALIFGLCSYNIFFLVKANITLIFDYGTMALFDGAFAQLIMLTFYGIISLACFLVFEGCKKVLVDKILK